MSEVLKICLNSDHYNRVIAPVRTTLGMDHGKRTEMAIDFNMPPWEDLFPVDHIYCCLGTTIKKAGSQGNFKKVDIETNLPSYISQNREKFSQFLD